MDTKHVSGKTTLLKPATTGISHPDPLKRKHETSFHSPQSLKDTIKPRCENGSCSKGNKVTKINSKHNKVTKIDSRENKDTPADHNENTIEDKTGPSVKSEIDENYDSSDTVEQFENILPCLGDDCDFSNIQDILTDCTGSACPPKDEDWYQLFLGIAKPDHNYFDRNWQNDQTNRRNYRGQTPQIDQQDIFHHRRNSFLQRKTDSQTKNTEMKTKHSEPASFKRKSHKKHFSREELKLIQDVGKSKEEAVSETLLSDAPKCRDDLCIESNEIHDDFEVIAPDVKDSDTNFKCPAGYDKETRGKVTFCKTRESLIETEEGPERKCEGLYSVGT